MKTNLQEMCDRPAATATEWAVSASPVSGGDLTEANMNTIRETRLVSMTLEEMIEADRTAGEKFHFYGSVWWREVKPFYFQPADIRMRIPPGLHSPNPIRALGGYYHMVPGTSEKNGVIVFNEIKDPATFDLAAIRKTKRYMIRRGLGNLRVERIGDRELLLGQGYDVYLDWERRTAGVRVRRSNPGTYRRWIERIVQHPYELILGAFAGDRLVAWVIARAVEGRADLSKAFSHSAFHHMEPTSTLIYAYILICGQNPQITIACDGLRSVKPSLEEYKVALGFKHITYPAYIHMNPLAKPFVRRFLPTQYKRLMGEYSS
jgi:hypothetical protein